MEANQNTLVDQYLKYVKHEIFLPTKLVSKLADQQGLTGRSRINYMRKISTIKNHEASCDGLTREEFENELMKDYTEWLSEQK